MLGYEATHYWIYITDKQTNIYQIIYAIGQKSLWGPPSGWI